MKRVSEKPKQMHASTVSWRWVAGASLAWIALLITLQTSKIGSYIDTRFAKPIDFNMRDRFGTPVGISDRLKVYAVDDSTVRKVGTTFLSLEGWADLIDLLVKNQPSAIFIDQVFGIASDSTGKFVAAIERAKAQGVQVGVGAFFTRQQLSYGKPLEVNRPEYSLSALLGHAGSIVKTNDVLPPMGDVKLWYGYGPKAEIRPSLSYIGHLIYNDDGAVAPLVRLGQDSAMGHLSTYAARDRRIENGKLKLDGALVPVDDHGAVTVNMPHPSELARRTWSVSPLVDLIQAGKPSSKVQAGDVVLLLPLMFTGNVDFHETPYGSIPGGYVQVAMFNSVITGNWLRPLLGGSELTAVFVVIGGLVGAYLFATPFWMVFLFVSFSLFILSQYLFGSQSIVVPWLYPLFGFMANSITVFAEKTRQNERRAEALRQALEGAVAPDQLKQLMRTPQSISFEARERVVTLMFIDVVGFSRLAENMMPRIAFEQLKSMLSALGHVVHEFGGVIDKTLGDGLLCYFGYRFDADTSTPDHAEKALRCAVKIQQENLARNLQAAASGDAVYPLRIGVNTSSCYLGDLGSENRIDFTVVGNGVNFAKRLEGACDMHSVLVGATTYDLVKTSVLPASAIHKRQIRIKHHSELVEAFEYDPFHDRADLRRAAIESFRKSANISRNDRRWPVNDPERIKVSCDFGDAELVNFSYTGFSLKLKKLLVKGTRMAISLDSPTGKLNELLAREGLRLMHGEVRWGYAEGDEFVHGVLVTNMTSQQSEMLVQYLCEFAFSWDQQSEQSEQDGSKAS